MCAEKVFTNRLTAQSFLANTIDMDTILIVCLSVGIFAILLLFVIAIIVHRKRRHRNCYTEIKDEPVKNEPAPASGPPADEELQRFESQNFKTCSQCGAQVQIGDNLCPTCGQVPWRCFGGEGRIRTAGPLRDTCFRDRHIRPLWHLSVFSTHNKRLITKLQ